MSFRLQPTPVSRPNRCQLFGPGSRVALFEKMAASAADVINLDLEDSVAPSDKDSARENIIQATHDVDWGSKTLSVRINGLDTPYWYRDVVDLLERASDRLDQIMIPKVGCAADVYAVDALATAIETAMGRAFLASLEEKYRNEILDRIRVQRPNDHQRCLAGVEESLTHYRKRGFAINLGDAGLGVLAVGVASRIRYGSRQLLFNCAVPGYRVKSQELLKLTNTSLSPSDFSTLLERR